MTWKANFYSYSPLDYSHNLLAVQLGLSQVDPRAAVAAAASTTVHSACHHRRGVGRGYCG